MLMKCFNQKVEACRAQNPSSYHLERGIVACVQYSETEQVLAKTTIMQLMCITKISSFHGEGVSEI